MSDTSALASRRAFWFGSLARNGLIGFRGTDKGADAGVDGVEKAADTLPLALNAGGGAGFAGGAAGMPGCDGGVSGAPNVVWSGASDSARGPRTGSRCSSPGPVEI